MKIDIAEKWITALESGEYTQGRDRLRRDNSFCCLGVLCDLYSKETGHAEWSKYQPGWFTYEMFGCDVTLPGPVQVWAGMNSSDGTFNVETDDDDSESSLAAINDSGKTFSEIVKVIKEKVGEL